MEEYRVMLDLPGLPKPGDVRSVCARVRGKLVRPD
jgi:hypothetical protein